MPTAENSANKGLVEIMPKIPSEKAHPKHHRTSQRAHADLPAIVGNTARGAKKPAKPAKTCHCRSRRRGRPLPAGTRREHSARCIRTSKTRKTHSAAIIDDERGHFLMATHAGECKNRPQDPESTHSRRNSVKYVHKTSSS